MSNSCQATTIKAGLPLIWARVSRAELGPLGESGCQDKLQILALHPVSHLINVGRGRRGQGVFDLKVEVERLCEEEEAESTHWEEGLWVVVVENQDLNK